jgi:putative transposase
VTASQQRAAAGYLVDNYRVSQRRASRVLARSRSTLRYRPRDRSAEAPLVRAIRRLARTHPRYGYRRVHALLERRGWSVNLKRVHRLWQELHLQRPARRRKAKKLGPKPGTSANSCVHKPPRFQDDVWTYDFIADRTVNGGALKWLTLVDEYTRECLALHVDRAVSGADVRRVLARVVGRRGPPRRIRSDNGSEFIGEALSQWLPAQAPKRSRWRRRAPGRTASASRSTAGSGMSSWRWRSSRTCRTLGPKGCGSGASTTRRGRTAPWAIRRPRSSVTPADAACMVNHARLKDKRGI